MRKRFHPLALLALAALTTAALAATDAVTLVRKPKKDEVHKYSMKADIDVNGLQVSVIATTQEKTTDVAEDGSYTVEEMLVDGKTTAAGQEKDLAGGPPSSMIYKTNGIISKINGDAKQATSNAYRMANLSLLYLPDKAVNVGDAWTYDVKADKATGAVAAKGEFKLLGDEKVGTHDTWKIKATIKETEGDTPSSSDGTVWIDKADGSMVKNEVKWVNAPFPGIQVPVNATVKIERIEK